MGEGTRSRDEVLDLLAGSALDHWRIETTVFTMHWPEAFALESPRALDSVPLYLHGPGKSLLYVQGPLHRQRLPALTAMVGSGQTVRGHDRGTGWSWVELEYVHEGVPWRRSHRVLDSETDYTCLVSAQATETFSALVEAAADEMAASLAPYNPEGEP